METIHSNSVTSNHHLVDFDWRIKAVVGSSTMIAHPPPALVEVDLHLCANNVFDENIGNVTDTVKLEMNSQELKMMINSLEKSLNNT